MDYRIWKNVCMFIPLLMAFIFIGEETVYAEEHQQEERPFIELEAEKEVSVQKKWEITFNQEMNDELFQENIMVADQFGKLVPVTIESKGNGKKAVIAPPAQGYENGSVYYLIINHKLQSAQGTSLHNPVMKKFETAYQKEQLVQIPDPNLKEAIVSQFDKVSNKISKDDMENLGSLVVPIRDIKSLEGLEYATNLRELHISSNSITDLSPLSELTDLEYLDVKGNNITSIDSVKKLSGLRGIDASRNNIQDLSPLQELSYIEQIRVDHNNIESLAPLKDLNSLEYLSVVDNPINEESLSWVSKLKRSVYKVHYGDVLKFKDPNLTKAIKENKRFEEDRPLYTSDIDTMNFLNLNSANIESIQGIEQLSNVQYLELSSNPIRDYDPLSDMVKLEGLEILYNDIEDISFVEELDSVKRLQLSFNNISDIEPLREMDSLEMLQLQENEITDISVLKDMENLRNVVLIGNQIEDLSVFQDLDNEFFWLYLGKNKISDLSSLVEMVENNQYEGIVDLSFNQLDLSNDKVQEDLSILEEHFGTMWSNPQLPQELKNGHGVLYGDIYSYEVVDNRQQIIEEKNAKVEVKSEDGRVITTVETNHLGKFVTPEIEVGKYQLTITSEDGNSKTTDISVDDNKATFIEEILK